MTIQRVWPADLGGEGGHLAVEIMDGDDPTEFSIVFGVSYSDSGLMIRLAHERAHVSDQLVERIAGTFARVIKYMIQTPHEPLVHLSKHSSLPAGSQDLLRQWNAAPPAAAAYSNVVSAFRTMARSQGSAPAVCSWDGDLTYSELDRLSNRLAYKLRVKHGIRSQSVVAFCCIKVTSVVVIMLAVWKAGGAFLAFDINHPPERRTTILREAEVSLILVNALERVATMQSCFPGGAVDLVDLTALERFTQDDADVLDELSSFTIDPHHAGYLVYTSGSTGRPKGIVLEHKGIATTAQEIPRIMGCVCMPSDAEASGDIAGAIRRTGANYVECTPTYATLFSPKDAPSVRTIVLGGEDRKDTQVKIRGQRIEMGEIEYHLNRQTKGDIKWFVDIFLEGAGQENSLAAFCQVSSKDAAILPASELGDNVLSVMPKAAEAAAAALRQVLPTYMVPEVLILLRKFPVVGPMKTDRKALRAMAHDFPHLGILAKTRTWFELSNMEGVSLATDLQALMLAIEHLPDCGTMVATVTLELLAGPEKKSVDLTRMREACEQIIRHHGILRTVLIQNKQSLLQVTLRNPPVKQIHVLSTGETSQHRVSVSSNMLDILPHFELHSDDSRVFCTRLKLTIHHAHYDAVSLGHPLSDLKNAYAGTTIATRHPSFHEWSSYVAKPDGVAEGKVFWRKLLNGSMSHPLAPSGADRESCHPHGTPATVFKAAWSCVLSQVLENRDIVFGFVSANRFSGKFPRGSAEQVPGPCINLVPMRASMGDGTITMAALVTELQNQDNQSPSHCTQWPTIRFNSAILFQNHEAMGDSISLGDTDCAIVGQGADSADIWISAGPRMDQTFSIELRFSPVKVPVELCLWISGCFESLLNNLSDLWERRILDIHEEMSRAAELDPPSPSRYERDIARAEEADLEDDVDRVLQEKHFEYLQRIRTDSVASGFCKNTEASTILGPVLISYNGSYQSMQLGAFNFIKIYQV
ncbi:acetyl-CoA synthetase-like protein [Colletotrichum eremochloae]|nr:acetyl-CoA synthetase-like protein [Colletotrichum eremochloae]